MKNLFVFIVFVVMLCGSSVVASAETVEKGVTGVVVKTPDFEELYRRDFDNPVELVREFCSADKKYECLYLVKDRESHKLYRFRTGAIVIYVFSNVNGES